MLHLALLATLPCAPFAASPASATASQSERTPEPLSTVVETFQTEILASHPLVGTIWDAQAEKTLSVTELAARISTATIILVGEKHDNPDHHRLQAAVTKKVTEIAPTIVVFEMIPTDRQRDLQQYLTLDPDPSPSRIGDAVGWEDLGWSPWQDYQAIAAAVLGQSQIPNQLALRAGNAPRSIASAKPSRELSMREKQQLYLDEPLEEQLNRDLEQQIVDSHCGMIPPKVAPAIAQIQRLRDAWMAREVLRAQAAAPESRIIVIAGGGHTRQDRAIPWYLRKAQRPPVTLTIRAVEVTRDVMDPRAYVSHPDAEHILWFTPRLDEKDPCDAFRSSSQ